MQKRTIVIFYILLMALYSVKAAGTKHTTDFVFQSKREIPVIQNVDVVVVGGTTAAVSAAVSAAGQGARVFLVAPKPYLGEDMCATLRLETGKERTLKTDLEKKIFQNSSRTTPLQVKSALNEALLNANVDYVFGSYVTDVLWDSNTPAGVVIANRAGRQAVIAKTIIDATDRGWVCRMAGAEVHPWKGAEMEFQRVVVLPGKDNDNPEYVVRNFTLPMADLQFPSFARAETAARGMTYTNDQIRAAESLFFIPPDPVVCKSSSAEWKPNKEINVAHFQTKGFENIFVLSGSADIPRSIADSLLRPAALVETGTFIGLAAVSVAKEITVSRPISVKRTSGNNAANGDVMEILSGLRPVGNIQHTILSPETEVPVLGHYDVVVVGGGTSGAPAAIAAGRWGMKVLVVEYLEGLGGIGTLGVIGKPYHGQKIGFAAEVPFPDGNIEPKMEWYRAELQKAGCDIWLGVLGNGVYMVKNTVKGAVVITPEGRGVVTAGVVIDATGSADLAIAAGASYLYGDIEKNDIALQGTGFSSRPLKGNYLNSDYLLVDESDMTDVWRALVSVHITKASENIYDAVPIIQNRERKRVVGDYVLDYLDQIAGRTFPDAIVYSHSDYDSHGYPSSPYFALLPHDEKSRKLNHPAPGGDCLTPYRCLLPKNLEGILVTGLGISMDRDASAMVRMQFDLANQGFASGIAAMLAVTNDVTPRKINVKELQKILIEKGNIPDSLLYLEDSFPLSKKIIKEAVKAYGEAKNPESAGKPLAIILSHQKKTIPLVKKEFKTATGKSQLLYAQLLGICGKKEGVPVLLAELEKFSGWDDKIYQGSMADYAHLPTPIDAVILALGKSGDKSVLPHLIKLVDQLDKDVTLSHFRSVALALEKMADPSAAGPLANLLQKPGIGGHAMTDIEAALTELDNDGKGPKPVKNSSYEKRTRALREIVVARALYRCGDYNGLAKSILENYRKDMQGLFARHANEILK